MKRAILSVALLLLGVQVAQATSFPFNGASTNQNPSYGYSILLGGKNGTTASLWYIHDDLAYWGAPGYQTWQSFTQSTVPPYVLGLGMTVRDSASAVLFDNTGIPDASYGNFWTTDLASSGGGMSYWSMADNWDNIEAGSVVVGAGGLSDIKSVTGYFAAPNGFAASNLPGYKMDLWSQTGAAPTNTSSFNGDVFSFDTLSTVSGWTIADTGLDRNFGALGTDNIWSLTYTFTTPTSLSPGTYYFSHSALATPEPGSLALCGGLGLIGLARAGIRRWRAKKS
jgi:hypothetical protein